MFELLGTGLIDVLQVKYLVPLFIGTLIGVVGGALPGITITMTVIVVLPFTFGLEPLQGLACDDRRLRRRRDRRAHHLVPARHSGQALGGGDHVRRLSDGAQRRAGGRCGSASGPRCSAGCSARWSSSPPPGRSRRSRSSSARGSTSRSSSSRCRWSRAWSRLAPQGPALRRDRLRRHRARQRSGDGAAAPHARHRLARRRRAVPAGADRRVRLRADHGRRGADGRPGSHRASAAAINLAVSHAKVLWEILSRPFLLLWSTFIGLVIGVLPAIGGSAANMLAYDQAKKFSSRPRSSAPASPKASSPRRRRTTPTSPARW